MKTLYVTDLDGTLLRTDDTVSPFTINTVNGLVDKGMLLLMRRPVLWFRFRGNQGTFRPDSGDRL